MIRYAEIHNGAVRHIGQHNTLPEFSPGSGLIAIDITQHPEVMEGWGYIAGVFTPSEPAVLSMPALIITALSVDETHAAAATVAPGFAEVDLPKGATIIATAELRQAGQVLVSFNGSFRLPIVASDGRERIARAEFVNGVAQVEITFPENGIWQISEIEVNKRLSPERHMSFAGITIYVSG